MFICVLVCVLDLSASQCACLCLHMITCVRLCSDVHARVCSLFFSFLTQGLCPLKGVPASQLRERKTRLEVGSGVRTGTKTREKTRESRQENYRQGRMQKSGAGVQSVLL